MSKQDIRWQQRFDNYKKALVQLEDAVSLAHSRQLSNLEKQGLIQAFEFTYELAWNTLKDYLVYQGIQNIVGSRDTIREAFNRELIDDGEAWMAMLIDRNKTSHTYNEEIAEEIYCKIIGKHHNLFLVLQEKMNPLLDAHVNA
ncbi:MAG: nucleotidyltransferase substrate binding protein [Proteobacteria bacterium]|nr:nucleotidyltransferase substrate binding protein [Pseudomonadota bacterium]